MSAQLSSQCVRRVNVTVRSARGAVMAAEPGPPRNVGSRRETKPAERGDGGGGGCYIIYGGMVMRIWAVNDVSGYGDLQLHIGNCKSRRVHIDNMAWKTDEMITDI